MYKVFLSSTSRDLEPYRAAVLDAIAKLDDFTAIAMESFGARAARTVDFDDRKVRESDLLVGLLGHCYGSSPREEPLSFTEHEYDAADRANKPCLMFVAPESFEVRNDLIEPDAQRKRQAEFRRRVTVKAERIVDDAFGSPEKLASAVTAALHNWAKEQREEASTARPLERLQSDTRPSIEPVLGPNPYRGLEAFRKEDADRFFGREALVEKLWQEFIALHRSATEGEPPVRLLTILGPSGCGKSSVAQAGLLAALDGRPLPGRPAAPSVVFSPETAPLESLAVALARHVTDDPVPAGKAMEFEKVLSERVDADGLRFLAAQVLGKTGVVLLVDQFEETYALCDDGAERSAFIDNLLNAARAPNGRVSIVLTLRSDFLGAVNDHPELSHLIAQQNVLVPVMGEDELHRAIEQPAKTAGEEIDQSTVDLLIEQTRGREGALPALEFVLTRIWEGFRKGAPSAETLHELGGVGGALAKGAQGVYNGLDKEDRDIARRAFVAMAHPGEGTKHIRRRAPLSEMLAKGQSEDDVLRVLRRFAEPGCRLITLAEADGTATAEVAHEALFDDWQLLQDWLEATRDSLRVKRRTAKSLDRWALRWVLVYGALFGVSALALFGFLYVATANVLDRQTAETIQADLAGLEEQYESQGLPVLSRVIQRRSADQPHLASIYLLLDSSGTPMAGNLTQWPNVEPDADGWVNFMIEVPSADTVEERRARARSFSVPGGFRLLVGREIEDRLQIQSLIRQAIGWGLALSLLLGLAGGFMMSRGMLARVEAELTPEQRKHFFLDAE